MTEKFRKLKLSELNRVDPETFKQLPKIPLILVLDNVRSLHNIGSAFRTADAFRIEAIYLTGFTAKPPHREIHKTALGATETVNWEYYNKPAEAINRLKDLGFKIIPVEQSEGSTMLNNFQYHVEDKIALILGNEVDGVSKEYMQEAFLVLEIPQQGTKHSLNVSVATGIVCWELFKSMSKTSN